MLEQDTVDTLNRSGQLVFHSFVVINCVVIMQRIILRQRRRYRIIITTAEGTGNDAGFRGQMANAPGGIAVAHCRNCQIHSMISHCPEFLGLAEIDDETPTCVVTVALMMWKTHSKDRLDAHETHSWDRDNYDRIDVHETHPWGDDHYSGTKATKEILQYIARPIARNCHLTFLF
jgi:hypothetical protein